MSPSQFHPACLPQCPALISGPFQPLSLTIPKPHHPFSLPSQPFSPPCQICPHPSSIQPACHSVQPSSLVHFNPYPSPYLSPTIPSPFPVNPFPLPAKYVPIPVPSSLPATVSSPHLWSISTLIPHHT